MRPSQVIALFAGLSAAFSWEGAVEDAAGKAVAGLEGVERLFRRQNDAETSPTTTPTNRNTNTNTNTRQTATGTGTRATGTGSRATITGSRTGSGDAAASGTAAATSTPVDPRQPPGGVSMMIPDVFAGSQFYKVGEWVTFAWNFTSVVNAPSAVNVIATCSSASAEWTIAGNMSYAPTQTVFWDTNQYKSRQTPQLVMATYTLIIENADEAKATGIAEAGGLSSWSQMNFGMYVPQDYVPFSEFTCPMCNSALGGSERQALGFMFTMISLTVLSFTYFSTGRFGVF